MQTRNNAISSISSLSSMDRIAARDKAREIIIARHGNKPNPEDFKTSNIGEYPLSLILTISILLTIAVLAGFAISATHINNIGQRTISHTINNETSIKTVGIALVLLSEVSALVFSLALAMVHDRVSKFVLYIGMIGATITALVGNIQDGNPQDAFAWVMAIIPPLLVLSLGYVGKVQILDVVKNRHNAKKQYQHALVEYGKVTANPEDSPLWKSCYANALKETLVQTNSKGRGKSQRIAAMETLTTDDWRQLVSRELQADNWFTEVSPERTEAPYSELQPQLALTQVSDVNFPQLATASIPEIQITKNGNGSKNLS